MDKYSYLNNLDNAVLDELFEQYKQDPSKVDESWRKFFEGFEFCRTNYKAENGHAFLVPNEFKVINLINGYRSRGHLFTRTNPVRTRRKYTPTLDIENFGIGKEELGKTFQAGKEIGIGNTTLQKIIDRLNQTYCQSIGAEFMYIRRPDMLEWLRHKMEDTANTPAFDISKKEHILEKLSEGVIFEKFVHKKFPGQKRFSLQGSETLIPALDEIMEKGSELGVEEIIIGMPHRGRLNVLAHILAKPYPTIFSEFEGKEYLDEELLGDVKYHLGFTNEIATRSGKKLRVTMAPNPSHLEAVDPVVEGITRARLDHAYQGDTNKIIPVLIHGDASISGQGIVYEVLQMAELKGYGDGGTIHLVVNNQLGFTTNYLDGRSSTYCTDVAKTLLCPVFHVNADDVEAVVYTLQMAIEFRQAFHKDVFIDLLGYRKYGHNESDEPRFTQPILYKAIESHPDPMELYLDKLREEGFQEKIGHEKIRKDITEKLESGLESSKEISKGDITAFLGGLWKHIRRASPEDFFVSPVTAVSEEILLEIGKAITSLPPEKQFFKKIVKLQEERKAMLEPGASLDWAMGELLAYGTLVKEGKQVRLSGQDTQRGTFSHRHAVLTVEDSEETFTPLVHVDPGQAKFEVYNSLLSEYGVLGFEYGYSLASPDTLTIWEAQFGDFNNGAQVVIDQYISSAEDKWNVMNGLVMYLPHGYEGQGPEHSSARMERFLALAGHYNIQVVNCTTPANLFHLLRRQLYRPFRKPLVLFTPKSLLRHPDCTSPLADFSSGGFKEVIDDPTIDPAKVKRVIFCSGKLYYDIHSERVKESKSDIALVRIEQLYPLPLKQLREVIARYSFAEKWEWIQEEPANMGAWKYIFQNFVFVPLQLTSRPASGSPATGSSILHKAQQKLIVEKALGKCTCEQANESCKLHCAEREDQILGRWTR
ncbi:MAG: 2-oxoglutarate dehydrogenase E1 component [Syntrophothermus sp.]